MKKTICISIAIAFVLSLFVCAVSACKAKDNFTGTKWTLSSFDTEGMSMSSDLLASFGLNGVLEFGNDGKFTLTSTRMGEDDSESGTFTVNGTFTVKDANTVEMTAEVETVTATIRDGSLVLEVDGEKMTFVKE